MTDRNDADDLEEQLRNALDDEREDDARDLAASLWNEREVTTVEVVDSGDGGTVELSKEGFLGFFSVAVDRQDGISRATEMGTVVYERHDERGYCLLEDVEVMASSEALDEMNAALDGVREQHKERRARRKEFRNMALGR